MFLDQILSVINSARLRTAIYWRAIALLPWSKARCATVQSIVFLVAKGFALGKIRRSDLWIGTDGLSDALLKRGWSKTTALNDLKPGMILFSQDLKGRKGAPDHTYTFHHWDSRTGNVAWIYDNNSPGLTRRNLGPGRSTPFEYALYPPV